MSLPTNKIKKVKLPNNTEYDIVPTMLQDGTTNNKLIVPTLNVDSVIDVTGELETSVFIISLPQDYEYYFMEIIPDSPTANYSAEFEIVLENDSLVLSNNIGALVKRFKCLLTSASTVRYNPTSTEYVERPVMTILQGFNSVNSSETSGTSWVLPHLAIRSPRQNAYQSAINSGHGLIMALCQQYATPVATAGNIKIKVKVYNTVKCKIKVFSTVTYYPRSTSEITLNNIAYPRYSTEYIRDYWIYDLWSNSVYSASQTVNVYSSTSGNTHYLTFTDNSLNIYRQNLFGNYNLYYSGSSNALCSTNGGFHTGSTNYKSNQVVYNGNTMTWPSKNGTIALTSDITNIDIEDLTEINS